MLTAPAPAAPSRPSTETGDAGPRLPFRPDIEGLRGLAVLLVIAYHADVPGFTGGFVGVDVFFVLSGYLITGLLATEVERTGRVDFARFYARRARRLLPAAALVLVATVLAGMWIHSPLEAGYPAQSAIATSLYAGNLYFQSALDYFAPAAERSPLLHAWSLAVEEQFYLAWPLLVLFLARRSRARLAAGLGMLTILSLAACVWVTPRNPGAAFYLTPLRAWEFGAGGLAWLLPGGWIAGRRAGLLAVAGTGAILAAGLLFSPRTLFPGWAATLPVIGTAALLAASAERPGGIVARGLGLAPARFIGRISYGWYLWHWPALVFAAQLVPGLSRGGRIAVVLLSLLAAWATHAWIERPIRESRVLAARPGRTLLGAAGLTAIALGITLAWYGMTVRRMRSPEVARYVEATKDRSPLFGSACVTGGLRDARVRTCAFGDTASAATVVLFGDSHAAQWFPAVQRAAEERGWKLVTIIKGGCPAPRVPAWNPRLRAEAPECAAWRDDALRRIAELRPAAVVMASWTGYVRHARARTRFGRLTAEAWGGGTRETLRAITAAGVPVLLVRDPPSPGVDVPACLAGGGACRLERRKVLNEEAFRAEADAARGLSVTLLDLTDRFCEGGTCPAERDGVVRYFDAQHVAARFAATMAPAFATAVEGVMGNAGD